MKAVPRHSTSHIVLLQFLTFNGYFYYWCGRSGGEINKAIGARKAPSAWWFIIPFGGYYWCWRYGVAIEEWSKSIIRRDEVILVYFVAINAWLIVPFLYHIFHFSGFDRILAFLVDFVLSAIVLIIGHGLFCRYIQERINQRVI